MISFSAHTMSFVGRRYSGTFRNLLVSFYHKIVTVRFCDWGKNLASTESTSPSQKLKSETSGTTFILYYSAATKVCFAKCLSL